MWARSRRNYNYNHCISKRLCVNRIEIGLSAPGPCQRRNGLGWQIVAELILAREGGLDPLIQYRCLAVPVLLLTPVVCTGTPRFFFDASGDLTRPTSCRVSFLGGRFVHKMIRSLQAGAAPATVEVVMETTTTMHLRSGILQEVFVMVGKAMVGMSVPIILRLCSVIQDLGGAPRLAFARDLLDKI